MNPYLQPSGFLGTGASLLADLTLLAYVLLLVPGMIVGYVFARRNLHRPHHKWAMIIITGVNWLLILFLMIVAYRFDVAGNIASQPGNPRYLMPTIHALFGLPAQLLATYVVYRMLREDAQVAAAKKRGERGQQLAKYWFKSAKPVMRLTLLLWLVTSLLGVFNYLIRYEVVPVLAGGQSAPAVTEEPVATDDPAMLSAPAVTLEPLVTAEPLVTSEADNDDDDSGNSGSGSGSSGSGSNNSGPGSANSGSSDDPASTPEP